MKARIQRWLRKLLGIDGMRTELRAYAIRGEVDAAARHDLVMSAIEALSTQAQVGRLQALERETKISDGVLRLEELVSPRAARLQERRPLVTDWDEIQRSNLDQFQEQPK